MMAEPELPMFEGLPQAPRYPDTPGYVRRDTSKAAADSIGPTGASKIGLRILGEIQVRGTFGATCDELEQVLGLSHQTASARIRELSMKGKLRATEARRKTRSNRAAIVWIAMEGQR